MQQHHTAVINVVEWVGYTAEEALEMICVSLILEERISDFHCHIRLTMMKGVHHHHCLHLHRCRRHCHLYFLQLCSLQQTDKIHNLLLLKNMPRTASTSTYTHILDSKYKACQVKSHQPHPTNPGLELITFLVTLKVFQAEGLVGSGLGETCARPAQLIF